MFKKTCKLFGLLLLLVSSFVYTDKVFSSAKASDPIMKEVVNYKKENDEKPTEPRIKDDEIILGYSGLVVDEEKTYEKMKKEDKFNEEKVVYKDKLPNTSISKTYDYYIVQGNPNKSNVSLIFKVTSDDNLDELLSMIARENVKATFFIDGMWLEENIETAFSMLNLGCEIYNLGYGENYTSKNISTTNNLIESITLKDSNYCLNEDKDEKEKEVCDSKKMHTIKPGLIEPTITELKEGLKKGSLISYDVRNFDSSSLSVIAKTISSRGYQIEGLSKVLSEYKK